MFLIKHFHSVNCQLFITTLCFIYMNIRSHLDHCQIMSRENKDKKLKILVIETYYFEVCMFIHFLSVKQDNPPVEQAFCFTSPFQTLYQCTVMSNIDIKIWNVIIFLHDQKKGVQCTIFFQCTLRHSSTFLVQTVNCFSSIWNRENDKLWIYMCKHKHY